MLVCVFVGTNECETGICPLHLQLSKGGLGGKGGRETWEQWREEDLRS